MSRIARSSFSVPSGGGAITSSSYAWTVLFGQAGIFTHAAVVGASDIDPSVLNPPGLGRWERAVRPLALGYWVAASANHLAGSGYAIGFGGLARTLRPAWMLVVPALLGFAVIAAYLV